jgi:hypothetical protein
LPRIINGPLITLLSVYSDDTDGLLSHDDGFLSHHLASFGSMVTSAGAFVFDDDPDYLSGDKMDINRLKIQVYKVNDIKKTMK